MHPETYVPPALAAARATVRRPATEVSPATLQAALAALQRGDWIDQATALHIESARHE